MIRYKTDDSLPCGAFSTLDHTGEFDVTIKLKEESTAIDSVFDSDGNEIELTEENLGYYNQEVKDYLDNL